jgi:hypothetical protein
VFAERGLWNDVLLNLDTYVRTRLEQEFSLPGRPACRQVRMPDRFDRPALLQLIQRRIRPAVGDLDTTGLSAMFPFGEEQLQRLEAETTVRDCLRKLSRWFNEIVFSTGGSSLAGRAGEMQPGPVKLDLPDQLKARWETAVAAAQKRLQGDEPRPPLIPDIQVALDVWLKHLLEQGLTGSRHWATVELVRAKDKGPYGYLGVVRLDGPDAPGIGIAAWLAQARGRPKDLRCRLEFFELVPCPIRTLVLFRRDGRDALTGDTKTLYEAAISQGRDVRVVRYDDAALGALLAFQPWLQSVHPDIAGAGPEGQAVFKAFLARLSERLIKWIDEWSAPQEDPTIEPVR